MPAYTRGTSTNIIVGAAAFFLCDTTQDANVFTAGGTGVPFVATESYKSSLMADPDWNNVGYTMNGLEMTFAPDFGEVAVDQVLDVAKLYKQGMQVNVATAFAEATLENLVFALAMSEDELSGTKSTSAGRRLNLSAGELGECPVERAICAVGPGTGDCANSTNIERVYVGYRALSIESVTVSAKRDEPSMFEVSFRLLPEDASGAYGKIVDRTHTAS